MRPSFVALCLALVALGSVPAAARAEPDPYQVLRAEARLALEAANFELRHYLRVEYPCALRNLDAQIEITKAEIVAYKQRLKEYWPFNKFQIGQPFLISLQDDQLRLLDAELRLKDLRAQRWDLIRSNSYRWRVLALQVQACRARLLELEGGGDEVLDDRST